MPVIEHQNKDAEKDYILVPITKASTKEDPTFVEVCLDDIPIDVYKVVIMQGLKHYLNGQGGMSKIGAGKTAGEIKAATEIAQKNLEAIYAGKIRMPAGSRSKVSGAVKTEAMRLARLMIKDALKAAGKKVSHISAKDITAAASALIESDKGAAILAQAKSTVEARAAEAESIAKGIDLSGVKEDPKLVEASKKKQAEGKKATQDKKAGKAPAQRQRPQGEARAN